MISFNIALDGSHLFRTDKMNGHYDIDTIQETLLAKFPASEGYTVSRADYPDTFTCTDLDN